jgi:hypothetical protein
MRIYIRHEKICETCGAVFSVPNYRKDAARFCSGKCKSSWVAKTHLNKGPKPWAAKNLDGHRHKSPTAFQAGNSPWNAGMKGIHLSPKSEFKAGRAPNNHDEVGAVKVRKTKGGQERAFVKIAEPSVWRERAKVVWEKHHGPIQSGLIIHHKDRNPPNDAIENLQAMTRAEHINEHRHELKPAPKQEGFDL